MKAPRILLLLLPLLLFGSKCKKAPTSGPTEVSGYTLNKNTGEHIPYIPIYFGVRTIGTGWGGFSKSKVGYSDENGFYKVEFEAEEGKAYVVNATDDNLYQGVPNDGLKIKPGVPNKLHIPLQPYGWIRLNLVNVPPLDTLEYFRMDNPSGGIYISDVSKDTSFIWKCQGNRDLTYGLSFRRDSNYVELLQTYVNGGDTGLYTFNF